MKKQFIKRHVVLARMNDNEIYAEKLRTILKLRHEPVAIKLVKKEEDYPCGYDIPEAQMSHCQAVLSAKNGKCFKLPLKMQGCNVGAACLNMIKNPEKVKSGEFHANIGIHESPIGAKNMIDARTDIPYETQGEIVCPLKSATFVPDVVAIVDIPERIYWFGGLFTYKDGGRVQYSTAPFQCACEDLTAIPIVTGKPNISLGCFGCRKKTDMKSDEMAIGIPFSLVPTMVTTLEIYQNGVFCKAKRD
ncbi:MAG: DUF169 domain-containing protein [archaeon]|nr:DUF169 domain-containing protein [archaeon]